MLEASDFDGKEAIITYEVLLVSETDQQVWCHAEAPAANLHEAAVLEKLISGYDNVRNVNVILREQLKWSL